MELFSAFLLSNFFPLNNWTHLQNGLLRHLHSNLCMDVSDAFDKGEKAIAIYGKNGLPMRECTSNVGDDDNDEKINSHQRWRFI